MSEETRKIADRIAVWLRAYLASAGADGYALGLSGGVDSATAAGLAVRAVGPDRVLGALLPCHSQPKDARLGQLVADTFGIPTVTVDLSETFDTLAEALPPFEHLLAGANIKPRLRMTALYFLAQSHNYLVLGGANKTELEVGYFTKHGDSGVDLMPLADVYKTEVWDVARALGVPQEVIERPPTAGLWPGQTDEVEMGITYDALDRTLKAIASGETDEIEPETLEKVRGMMRSSAHKRAMPPVFLIGQQEG